MSAYSLWLFCSYMLALTWWYISNCLLMYMPQPVTCYGLIYTMHVALKIYSLSSAWMLRCKNACIINLFFSCPTWNHWPLCAVGSHRQENWGWTHADKVNCFWITRQCSCLYLCGTCCYILWSVCVMTAANYLKWNRRQGRLTSERRRKGICKKRKGDTKEP